MRLLLTWVCLVDVTARQPPAPHLSTGDVTVNVWRCNTCVCVYNVWDVNDWISVSIVVFCVGACLFVYIFVPAVVVVDVGGGWSIRGCPYMQLFSITINKDRSWETWVPRLSRPSLSSSSPQHTHISTRNLVHTSPVLPCRSFYLSNKLEKCEKWGREREREE